MGVWGGVQASPGAPHTHIPACLAGKMEDNCSTRLEPGVGVPQPPEWFCNHIVKTKPRAVVSLGNEQGYSLRETWE